MFGVQEKTFSIFINTLSIITKQHIYACRCRKIKPNINVVIEKVKFEKFAEKSFCTKNNKMAEWYKKWELLENITLDITLS